MKFHSGWLAAGLLLLAVLACSMNKNANNSNNSNNSNNKDSDSSSSRRANADVYVDQVNMAKDNNGEPGDSATTFSPDDRTIHCVIKLNKAKAGTAIRFVWKAVDVKGIRSGEFQKIDYTTNSFENIVHGHLTYPEDWPKGTYQVEVYINDALDKTISYSVE